MSKYLDALLDKCIDRMNEGDSLEECLADYPEQAEELRPLLRAMSDVCDTCSTMPRATARSVTRRRLDAALVDSERSLRKPQRRPTPFFGGSKVWATVSAVLVLALVGFGLYWVFTPGAPVVAQDNFRLLLSDEENAIGDFESLNIWVTSIGLLRGGEPGSWTEFEPAVKSVDLTLLQGDNALEIWSGQIPDGQYTEVFIYVDHVTGVLKGAGEVVIVKLPGGRFQISTPFEVTTDSLVNFVYDLTVVAVSDEESGVKYILKPQVDQSGTGHEVNEVMPGKVEIKGLIADFELVDGEGWIEIASFDQRVFIDDNSEIEGIEEGTPPDYGVVDLMAEVEAVVQTDDSFLATEIEVVEEEESSATKVEIKGLIEDFYLPPDLEVEEGWVEILGLEVTIDDNTEVEGTIEVDLMAEAEAVVQPDDSLLATEIEIEVEEEAGESEGDSEQEVQDGESEDELTLQVVTGTVAPGESITVLVTFEGSPVEGATITVNDTELGEKTDANGLITFDVPLDDELKIEAELGELDGKLKIDL